MADLSFTCSCCGKRHDGLPDIRFEAPRGWSDAAAGGDRNGNRLGTDFCILGDDLFIRCVLLVPIRSMDESFGWGVWLSQSEANFRDYVTTFPGTPERSTFGYLWNRLPLYPDTVGMEARAHWQSGKDRPLVELKPVDNPLYHDWHDGITMKRAIEFAQLVFHPSEDQQI